MPEYQKYSYDGPVMVFNNCVALHWYGETIAPSESKARCNLAYQYKQENKLEPRAKVTLPGVLDVN